MPLWFAAPPKPTPDNSREHRFCNCPFVLTHCSCNTSKGDKLEASKHLHRWVERNRNQRTYLAEEFDRRKIIHSLEASERVAE